LYPISGGLIGRDLYSSKSEEALNSGLMKKLSLERNFFALKYISGGINIEEFVFELEFKIFFAPSGKFFIGVGKKLKSKSGTIKSNA